MSELSSIEKAKERNLLRTGNAYIFFWIWIMKLEWIQLELENK